MWAVTILVSFDYQFDLAPIGCYVVFASFEVAVSAYRACRWAQAGNRMRVDSPVPVVAFSHPTHAQPRSQVRFNYTGLGQRVGQSVQEELTVVEFVPKKSKARS